VNNSLSVSDHVAGVVRAELARRRMSGSQAAERLGWTQPYISRRLTGRIPFDIEDLAQLSGLLGVEIIDFLPAPGKGSIMTTNTRILGLAS
jgi:transcriptional regulator with XRE-family HTH domain